MIYWRPAKSTAIPHFLWGASGETSSNRARYAAYQGRENTSGASRQGTHGGPRAQDQNAGQVLRRLWSLSRCDIGLGSARLVSLAEAREEALRIRRKARDGEDPLAERRRTTLVVPTFKEAAETVHEAHAATFKNAKHKAQWLASLKADVFPLLGDVRVSAIQSGDVLKVLSPTLSGRVRERLRQHAQRHGGLLFEHRPVESADAHREDRPMPERCRHGIDSRFCSLCNLASRRMPRQTHTTAATSRAATRELQDIVRFLNEAQVRATYGAVAELVGGIARGIGARLTALYSRSPEASWVVSAESGMPSGYVSSERHPGLLNKTEIISSGRELEQRMARWQRTR